MSTVNINRAIGHVLKQNLFWNIQFRYGCCVKYTKGMSTLITGWQIETCFNAV